MGQGSRVTPRPPSLPSETLPFDRGSKRFARLADIIIPTGPSNRIGLDLGGAFNEISFPPCCVSLPNFHLETQA